MFLSAITILSATPPLRAARASAHSTKNHHTDRRSRLARDLGGSRAFSPGSVWNLRLASGKPLDPESGRLVAELNRLVAEDVSHGSGPWINTSEYSTPIYTVPAGQPTLRVTLDNTDPQLQAAFDAVPIPAFAQPAAGTDHHMVIYQPSRDRMWEFWLTQRLPDGWHARWGGAMNRISQNPGYFTADSWPGARSNWGATASSLPLLAGLIRTNEARRGRINHAVALNLPQTRAAQYVHPAQRTDGAALGENAIPEGAHFRLDPNLDINALRLPPLTRAIAKAAQTYGVVIRDRSGVVAFAGEDPTPTHTKPWTQILNGQLPDQQLKGFPWKHLQLLKMD